MSGKSPMEVALSFLNRRVYTEQKLTRRLAEAGLGPADIEEVLNRLKSWGYLNDREYGIHRIETLQARLKSRMFIEGDLLASGLNPELIQELIRIYYPESLEIDIARRLMLRKSRTKRANKTLWPAFLMRAGFSEDTIRQCFPEVSST